MTTSDNSELAIVLLSGGFDSAVCLFEAMEQHANVCAIGVDYGQVHAIELEYARALAKGRHVPYYEVACPMLRGAATNKVEQRSPYYVPNRNLMLLALAHSYADLLGYASTTIYHGANAADQAGFPDCRPAFFEATATALMAGSGRPCEIRTPLIALDKAGIWQRAEEMNVAIELRMSTFTCYMGETRPNAWGVGCGECPACEERRAGWYAHQRRIEEAR